MPVPVKARGPRPPAPAVSPVVDLRRPDTRNAMDPGPSAVAHARRVVGNAAMTAAMGGLPRGAEPRPSAWMAQMLLAGQNLVGNQAVATRAGAPVPAPPAPVPSAQVPPPPSAPTPSAQVPPAPGRATPTAPVPAPAAARKPAPRTGPQAVAPSAAAPDQKGPAAKDKQTAERPDRGTKKEKAAGPRSPGADPKFQALKKDVNAKKKKIGSSHPPATVEAGSAQAAAQPPADDREARGKAAHAEDMDAAQPKEFNKQAFIDAVKKAIADRAPKNLDEADKFGDSGKAEEVKTEVQGKVGEGKDASAKEIAEVTAEAPAPAPDAKQVVPMAPDKPPGKPGTPNPNQAAPNVLPASATDMSAGPRQVDQQMAEAQVTERQLSFKNAREPSFDKAVREKKTMEAHSSAAPKELRAGESRELKEVKNTAAVGGAAAMAGIHATRVSTGKQVGTGKTGTKTRDEDKRKQVTELLQKVFDQTKCDVEKILTDLDKKVDDEFTTKEKRARDNFTAEHEEGMRRYKDERYGGWTGWARWTKDLFAGLPEEANRIYERARDTYLAAMDQIITDIADTVERELRLAKDRIAAGRKELKAAVDKLPADLRAIGREAAADFEGKFDELKDTVNDKGSELVDALATRYADAVKAVDEEIAAEKEKNKGLVAKAAEAIGGAIKAIIELGRMLMGVLRKAVTAIGAILKDPIGFLGRLVTGVGGGLKLFKKNAGRHLEAGVLAWLLGTGAAVGLQLPLTFDVLGILTLIAAMLGLSWPSIRARLARRVPDQAITAAETSVPLVAQVKRRGVAGMWDDLKSRVGDLKKNLIRDLVSYLLPTIVIAGITWIVSLFNPASAFIRACKMIIDIIRFIVTNARQIIDFVNAVLDAVIAIARGGSGGVPALVERALVRSIPVLIGALAAILGIGGIAGKVRQIFQKLARPVNRAVDWVINKIVGLVKKLWAKLKAALDRKKKRPKTPSGKPVRDRTPARRRRDDRRGPKRRRPDRRRSDRRRDRRSDKARQRSLDAALREATRLLNTEGATVESVRRGLPAIKRRHRLTGIRLESAGAGETYFIELAINPRKRTRPRKFAEKRFPYVIGRAEPPVKIDNVPPVIDTLRPVRIPFQGSDPMTGFVINMSATPSEVRPNIAARYLVEAWKGSGADNLAAARTAVVIGVNTLERLDPAKDKAGRNQVRDGVRRIKRPAKLLLVAFGFVWTPSWRHKTENRPASMDEVRRVYMRLTSSEKAEAVARNERRWQPEGKLPYGVFHEVGFLSEYTQRAVEILGKVNRQVYSVSQDPDTDVTTQSGMGFLRKYDEVLRDAANDRVLVIGGYHFEGFDWGPLAKSRTAQLTLLANRLDRAMKVAIGKVYPQLLYPAEPNMLIKVWERDTSRQIRLIFQDPQLLAELRAAESQGSLWGIGAGEGRHVGEFMKGRHGVSVIHVPDAALTTSPLPGTPERGLTMTPEDVHLFASEAGHPRYPDLPRHRVYGALMQSQTVLTAHRLASAFGQIHSLDDATKAVLAKQVFTHVEAAARLMADDPNLTARSPVIMERFDMLDAQVKKLLQLAAEAGDQQVADVVKAADLVTQEMIKAMTADDLKKVWHRLSKLLNDIMRDAPPSRGGPR
jgi:hypothetical protein